MPETNTQRETVGLAISGMSCGHCVARVKKILAAVPGIAGADVAVGHATITLGDGARDRVVATATAALGEAGYEARSTGQVATTTAA
ncbi:hypothetical protein BH09GEM1_BH09GEM1_19690 [soil metagenome]